MPKLNFDPSKDIPDLIGKTFLITGGTAGLGFETAVSLASHHPAHILFTGRSQSSADKLLAKVQTECPKTRMTFVRCDQTSLASVQEAAKVIIAKTERLDVIIANAGIMAVPPAVTKDGYETQFGTNHLSHALLVKLLLPSLEKTASQTSDARVIWLTSLGYGFHTSDGVKFDTIRTDQKSIVWWSSFFSAWMRYGQSKLANLLYARQFPVHHPNITSIAIHPGTAATGLVTGLPWHQRLFIYVTAWNQMIPAEQCAWNTQWAATCEKEALENGAFYEPVGMKGRLLWKAKDEDGELAKRLWEWTARELERWI